MIRILNNKVTMMLGFKNILKQILKNHKLLIKITFNKIKTLIMNNKLNKIR